MRIPINITGGTYRHKSLPLSAQVTRNLRPELQTDKRAKSPYILESFVGMTLFADFGSGKDRGMLEHQGVLYKVTGTKLYSVDEFGEETELGSIPGVLRCIMFGTVEDTIIIVTGGVAYQWDGATLDTGVDVDFETPNSGAYLNSQALYDGDDNRFGVSNVGDFLNIDGLNYASAESASDALLRVYVYDQLAYMMGEKTIEPWWDSGVGSPPFDRVEGGIIPVGLGAIHSVANTDRYMYFFDDEDQVQRVKGSTPQVVSTPPLTREISTYARKNDAIGWCMTIEGQPCYVLTFPTANKTWVLPEEGEWFEWSSGLLGGRCIANSYAKAFGKHLVSDYRDGKIYELSTDVYDEDGEPIVRRRDTAPIHGALVGAAGRSLEMNEFMLIMETGVGLTSGQGSDPVVMLSYSDDGGKTFCDEIWGEVGKIGAYRWEVKWTASIAGQFDERIMSIRFSDPVPISIHYAEADLSPCI